MDAKKKLKKEEKDKEEETSLDIEEIEPVKLKPLQVSIKEIKQTSTSPATSTDDVMHDLDVNVILGSI